MTLLQLSVIEFWQGPLDSYFVRKLETLSTSETLAVHPLPTWRLLPKRVSNLKTLMMLAQQYKLRSVLRCALFSLCFKSN
jgi:hypothetical protein